MKKIILGFILGAVIAGSITGVIAYNYNAKNVTYTPSDNTWDVNNVEDAIKDLRKLNNGIKEIAIVFGNGYNSNVIGFNIENMTHHYGDYDGNYIKAGWNASDGSFSVYAKESGYYYIGEDLSDNFFKQYFNKNDLILKTSSSLSANRKIYMVAY